MKKSLHILTLIILTLLIGCYNSNKDTRKNRINRIVFATGGCYGACPIEVIDIDSSLTFRYHGIKNTDSLGFYIGTVTPEFWDSLNIKLERINYQQFDSSYENSVDDLSTEIFIYSGDRTKHIQGQSSSLSDSVMTVYHWLIKSIRQLELKPTSDSLTFPTFIDKPLPIPTMSENTKFTPPKAEDK